MALARAIVFKPDILLLDEPLGALDRKLREEVRGEIHQLQRRLGITTIMVTHDQDEALSLSDRIVVLHGRVQQIDTPINAYHRPNSRFVADFLGLANFLAIDGGRTGLVRPERIRLEAAGMNGGTQARVIEAVYLGQMVRYHLVVGRRHGASGGGRAFHGPRLCRGRESFCVVGRDRPVAGRVREQPRRQR